MIKRSKLETLLAFFLMTVISVMAESESVSWCVRAGFITTCSASKCTIDVSPFFNGVNAGARAPDVSDKDGPEDMQWCSADCSGIELSGLCNVALCNYSGAQFAGLYNASMNMSGIQVAGLKNTCGGDINGLQLAILSNCTGLNTNFTGICRGIQIAGLSNRSCEVAGLQIAGFGNICYGKCYGLQVGIFNYCGELHGLQIGIGNIAKCGSGVQIGLFNSIGDALTLPIINASF